ncbi:hypothetical protein AAG570_004164 [Ranatra chinensis]|uniref:Uncharacterized protein n=1 Tax=Ranatra chinensis TaxID=642074 RepID=A0ABD0Y321_9HEMI
MFYENKKQETTDIGVWNFQPFVKILFGSEWTEQISRRKFDIKTAFKAHNEMKILFGYPGDNRPEKSRIYGIPRYVGQAGRSIDVGKIEEVILIVFPLLRRRQTARVQDPSYDPQRTLMSFLFLTWISILFGGSQCLDDLETAEQVIFRPMFVYRQKQAENKKNAARKPTVESRLDYHPTAISEVLVSGASAPVIPPTVQQMYYYYPYRYYYNPEEIQWYNRYYAQYYRPEQVIPSG